MGYHERLIDYELDELIPQLSAICVDGAKGVGKTATLSRRAKTSLTMDRPELQALYQASPELVLQQLPLVFIDEWQLVPHLWDEVRHAVDNDPSPGRFLLAGSSTPVPGLRLHSGAGRIVRLLLRPMSLVERGLTNLPGGVSMAQLLTGNRLPVSGLSEWSLVDYVSEMAKSGFPGLRNLSKRARQLQLDSYVSRLLDHEFEEFGARVRKPHNLQRWLRAYAVATSTVASYTTILDAATAGEAEKPARSLVANYREVLEQLWIIDDVPAWMPGTAGFSRLATGPKHHLVDPALAIRLLGLSVESLLRGEGATLRPQDGPLLGNLFESFVTLCVRSFAQPLMSQVYHLRDRNGEHEIDLIVEGPDHRVLAIEVKLGATVDDREVRHLNWLERKIGDQLLDKVVINTGPGAYRRSDGVAVVPLACLTR